ncbi:beta-N-acetylglucosaminidase domain-containing protein [Salinibacillus xinjiangensis]|uniref:Beta-N-acetylhexosaminidase n=1 Tax=Salinibacillus xinjiangensis TaxID=1229268 RepID=A0A6G1X8J0_9BACI|nr:beta-N-acetylglucosaminidase domain-containing protein [Salinibacillus xinjiangensis]MRG87321.1 beta-N-acetylhexosaminidase [Salinibacillus xinjiangensis]
MLKGKKIRKVIISISFLLVLIFTNGIQNISNAEENLFNKDISISPVPKSIEEIGKGFPINPKVGLVKEVDTDPMALREVKETLKEAGVRKIVESNIHNSLPTTAVTIWVGEFSDENDFNLVKEKTGIDEINGKHKEGYTLYSGRKNDKKHIVLMGNDSRGTFYSAQSLGQLILKKDGTDWMPEVIIKDWPTFPIRGAIEGFYGEPWSHEDRLSQIEFYGEHKMNSYIYAPKDDPYHRAKWREPYPEEKLNEIEELVQTSEENHVEFTFAISPGVTVAYSNDEDFEKLVNKAEQMWDIGVRSFAIFLDDIDPNLRHSEDKEMFGDDENPSAAAQAYLLNRFNEEFIKQHEGAERLITVPTEYSQAGTTPYRERFAELVDSDVIVQWTGIGVVAPTITTEDADLTYEIFDHDLLIWDNYPVNDMDRNSLFLGPLVGRDNNLSPENGVIGSTANPMNEAEASKIPLFTVADYLWNPKVYNPTDSIERSIQEFGGDAAQALKTFVDSSYSSLISGKEPFSEELAPNITEFWKAYENEDELRKPANELLDKFTKLEEAPSELRNKLDNENFLDEVDPYLDKMELYGKAGKAAVHMLLAEKENDPAAVAEHKEQLESLLVELQSIPQTLGLGTVQPFFERVLYGENLAEGKTAIASSSEVDWLTPELATDGDSSTRWASLYNDDEWIYVDLGDVYTINQVVLQWEAAYGKEYKIQVSKDGEEWTDVYTENTGDGGTDRINFNPTQAQFVKMQGLKRATGWGYSLYEFKVYEEQ